MTLRRLAAAAALALLAASCAASTMRDALGGKAAGTAAVYPVPPGRAWSIARGIVFRASPIGVVSNRERTMITCDAGTGTDTTFIAVWIDPGPTAGESLVTIRSVRKGAAQIVNLLPEADFHARFAEAVGGKPDPGR